MTHTARQVCIAGMKGYKSATAKDAYERGFDRGYNCASWVDVPEIGTVVRTDSDGKVTIDEDSAWEVMASLAYESESNDRSYSPFEFTASEFNKALNSEARWEAFDAGISQGINANLQERHAQYIAA
jgi:hypothetical protein